MAASLLRLRLAPAGHARLRQLEALTLEELGQRLAGVGEGVTEGVVAVLGCGLKGLVEAADRAHRGLHGGALLELLRLGALLDLADLGLEVGDHLLRGAAGPAGCLCFSCHGSWGSFGG